MIKKKPISTLSIASILAILTTQICVTSEAHGATIYSDANDGQVEMRSDWTNPAIQNTNDWNMGVGEWYGNGLLSAVMPFQLPDFGAVSNPFTSAEFGVNLYEKGNATVTSIDLYAVRVNASPSISATDYYSGSSADPSATLVQAGFLTPSSTTTSVGLSSGANNLTSVGGSAVLLNFLNSSYNNGSGAGQYVFLRLSYASGTYAAGWDAYKITSRNAGLEGDWPAISYSAIPEPASFAVLSSAGVFGLAMVRRRRNSAG